MSILPKTLILTLLIVWPVACFGSRDFQADSESLKPYWAEINSFPILKRKKVPFKSAQLKLQDVAHKLLGIALDLCEKEQEPARCFNPAQLVLNKEPDALEIFSDENHIFIPVGLINAIEYDAELAFALSHEIAHQILGHSPDASGKINGEKLKRGIMGASLGATSAYLEGNTNMASESQRRRMVNGVVIGGFANAQTMSEKAPRASPYSIRQILEADRLAFQMLKESDYVLSEARQFLLRMAKAGIIESRGKYSAGAERLRAFDKLQKKQ